jgi:hypothetical protein
MASRNGRIPPEPAADENDRRWADQENKEDPENDE